MFGLRSAGSILGFGLIAVLLVGSVLPGTPVVQAHRPVGGVVANGYAYNPLGNGHVIVHMEFTPCAGTQTVHQVATYPSVILGPPVFDTSVYTDDFDVSFEILTPASTGCVWDYQVATFRMYRPSGPGLLLEGVTYDAHSAVAGDMGGIWSSTGWVGDFVLSGV